MAAKDGVLNNGADRLHRTRQYGSADGAQPDQGRTSGRRLRSSAPPRSDKLVAAGGVGRRHRQTRSRRVPRSSSPCCRRASRCARSISAPAASLDNAKPGTLLIDCSTIDVETARAVAAAAEAKGLLMIDAPVSGGVGGAQGGNAHLHGRRQRQRVRASAKPMLEADGQDDRACRRIGQRPGGKDLQQHDPRRVDDRGVGSVRACREARARCAEAVRHFARNPPASAGR